MRLQPTSLHNKWGLMIKGKNFYVTYYAKKHSAFITRKAKWTDDCKAWTSQLNKPCMTYYDIDADAYRTAVGNLRIINGVMVRSATNLALKIGCEVSKVLKF